MEACDYANITHSVGGLMSVRRQFRLVGRPFSGTVNELIGTIKTISESVVSTHVPGCNPFHGIDELAGDIWHTIGSPLGPETRDRLRKHALVSGLAL